LLTSFDLLLIGLSLLVFAAGLVRLRATWRQGRQVARPGDWKGLLLYLLGHRKILKNGSPGTAHLALFWGICFYMALAILAQFGAVVPVVLAKLVSLLSDVLGLAMLAGLVFFTVRRLGSQDSEPPEGVLLPLAILLVIVLSGFWAEGARLSLNLTDSAWYSPAGWFFALLSPASPLFMQLMVRIHFFAVLLLLALIPFTFLRHLITSSLNVYYRRQGPAGRLDPVDWEGGVIGADKKQDFTWKQLLDAQACVSCGRCEQSCPAHISGKPLSPRKIIRSLANNLRGPDAASMEQTVSSEELWACTTCMACVEKCPVLVEPLDKLLDMRRYQVMDQGRLPREAREMMRNLELFGDTNGQGPAHRQDWALGLEVPHISSLNGEAEILLWVGCSGAFHPQYQEVTRSMVHILKAAGVSFGILGKEESCCGDSARRLGDEERFEALARKNIAAFKKYDVETIVCLCPHGYNTLRNEYPALGGRYQVLPAAQYVLGLIEQNRISPKYPVAGQLAIHDPCYLGRANGIYEPLRQLGNLLPGTTLVELERNRENGFCCGGGGGRMWLHENIGENINNLRAGQVAQSGVDTVATACPFCLTMLEDGINFLEQEDPVKVRDIIEIVAMSLGRAH
jgi:Fe-S oxidoreductase/nitrate reductase gamma subunit